MQACGLGWGLEGLKLQCAETSTRVHPGKHNQRVLFCLPGWTRVDGWVYAELHVSGVAKAHLGEVVRRLPGNNINTRSTFRLRASMNGSSRGQNRALTVLYVPCSLDSGQGCRVYVELHVGGVAEAHLREVIRRVPGNNIKGFKDVQTENG